MKKIISSAAVCSIAMCMLASCGSKDSGDKKEKTSKAVDLTGKWAMENKGNETVENGGIILTDDGKGSIYADSSKIMNFTDDGFAVGMGDNMTVLSKDYFKEEGKTLTVDVMGNELLVITKLDDTEGYDGLYSLDGGTLYDGIIQGMSKGDEEDVPENVDITLDFDGTHSEVVFNDLFNYSVKGDKLTLTGYSGLMGLDAKEGTADFKLEGDTLTITSSTNTETLTRVK